MGASTEISWTDSTWNPWIGCTNVSPACDHCYAEARMDTRLHRVKWGAGQPRSRTSEVNWGNPGRWNKQLFGYCHVCGKRDEQIKLKAEPCLHLRADGSAPHDIYPSRRRVFCASLADWLDNEVPIEWFADLLETIRCTPNLDWLLLTKRIGNFWTRLEQAHHYCEGDLAAWIFDWQEGRPPVNVWMGSTIVTQPEFDRDWRKLAEVPAVIRFLSVEPMLSAIDTRDALDVEPDRDGSWRYNPRHNLDAPRIHWIIAGGESGHHARPSDPRWFIDLRDQCKAADVAFHFKQYGEWLGFSYDHPGRKGNRMFPEMHVDGKLYKDSKVAVSEDGGIVWARVGRSIAGRSLNGIEHNGFPL